MTEPFCSTRRPCGQFCTYSRIKFPKYIPVQQKKKKFKFPTGKIDVIAPGCWLDIHAWYADFLYEKNYRKKHLKTSLSDSVIGSTKAKKKCQHFCDMNEQFFDWTCRKPMVKREKRFGISNIQYLTYGSSYESHEKNTSVEFYIKIEKDQQPMLRLCHLKTELIVNCLQIFFKPYDNTTVLWVNDLDYHIEKATKYLSKDIFNELVKDKGTDVKAILYVDKHASNLIRHKDLCFIETLAKLLEIDKNEICILSMSNWYESDFSF